MARFSYQGIIAFVPGSNPLTAMPNTQFEIFANGDTTFTTPVTVFEPNSLVEIIQPLQTNNFGLFPEHEADDLTELVYASLDRAFVFTRPTTTPVPGATGRGVASITAQGTGLSIVLDDGTTLETVPVFPAGGQENQFLARGVEGSIVWTTPSAIGSEQVGLKPEPATPLPVVTSPTRVVNVTDRASLLTALAGVQWGDKIVLAAGNYGSHIFTSPSLTGYDMNTPPPGIWITGPRTAIIDGGSTADGIALHCDGADYIQLEGFTVTGGQKGVMVDESNFMRLVSLAVGDCGHEAIHLRNNSCDNLIQDCAINNTGLTSPGKGEGIYIGQPAGEWTWPTSRTNGQPDRSNRNRMIGNTLTNIRGECFDLREGTTGGVVQGNSMNGSAISGTDSADSYIDVKGNNYLVDNNTATSPSAAVVHAFTTHIRYAGFGNFNVFKKNSVTAGSDTTGAENSLNGGAQGYNIQTSGTRGSAVGNVVYSDNTATSAPGGLTNIPVTAV